MYLYTTAPTSFYPYFLRVVNFSATFWDNKLPVLQGLLFWDTKILIKTNVAFWDVLEIWLQHYHGRQFPQKWHVFNWFIPRLRECCGYFSHVFRLKKCKTSPSLSWFAPVRKIELNVTQKKCDVCRGGRGDGGE